MTCTGGRTTNYKLFLLCFLVTISGKVKLSVANDFGTNDIEDETNRHKRSISLDSDLDDLGNNIDKRAPQLSINQDLHNLAANLKGAKGRDSGAASLYRLGKRSDLSVNQDSRILAEAMRGRRASSSIDRLQR